MMLAAPRRRIEPYVPVPSRNSHRGLEDASNPFHFPNHPPPALAHLAKVERSHMGKTERGEHMPTLVLVLKIAKALGTSSGDLMYFTEALLPPDYLASEA